MAKKWLVIKKVSESESIFKARVLFARACLDPPIQIWAVGVAVHQPDALQAWRLSTKNLSGAALCDLEQADPVLVVSPKSQVLLRCSSTFCSAQNWSSHTVWMPNTSKISLARLTLLRPLLSGWLLAWACLPQKFHPGRAFWCTQSSALPITRKKQTERMCQSRLFTDAGCMLEQLAQEVRPGWCYSESAQQSSDVAAIQNSPQHQDCCPLGCPKESQSALHLHQARAIQTLQSLSSYDEVKKPCNQSHATTSKSHDPSSKVKMSVINSCPRTSFHFTWSSRRANKYKSSPRRQAISCIRWHVFCFSTG